MREFVAILGFDEDIALRYDETNGHGDTAPGDFLEREFNAWIAPSGITLEEWALVDCDDSWDKYLRYLTNWVIDHNSEEFRGMSPISYDEWQECEAMMP